jgi:hypothetical protein
MGLATFPAIVITFRQADMSLAKVLIVGCAYAYTVEMKCVFSGNYAGNFTLIYGRPYWLSSLHTDINFGFNYE